MHAGRAWVTYIKMLMCHMVSLIMWQSQINLGRWSFGGRLNELTTWVVVAHRVWSSSFIVVVGLDVGWSGVICHAKHVGRSNRNPTP